MNLLEILKDCEPNVSQIARDAKVSRQAVYLYTNDSMPVRDVWERLAAIDKYAVLRGMDYDTLRAKRPIGCPKGCIKNMKPRKKK